jgi:hypothetical protein
LIIQQASLTFWIGSQALEKEMSNFSKEQGKHISAAKAKLKASKSDVEAAKKLMKAKQAAMAEAVAQRDAAGSEREALSEQEKASEQAVKSEPPFNLALGRRRARYAQK